MAKIYATLIKKGLKTIEEVPEIYTGRCEENSGES